MYIKRNIDGNKILISSIEQANEIISTPHQESVSKTRPEVPPKPRYETTSMPRPPKENVSSTSKAFQRRIISQLRQETGSKPRFDM